MKQFDVIVHGTDWVLIMSVCKPLHYTECKDETTIFEYSLGGVSIHEGNGNGGYENGGLLWMEAMEWNWNPRVMMGLIYPPSGNGVPIPDIITWV